jgi:hypothetical protein
MKYLKTFENRILLFDDEYNKEISKLPDNKTLNDIELIQKIKKIREIKRKLSIEIPDNVKDEDAMQYVKNFRREQKFKRILKYENFKYS